MKRQRKAALEGGREGNSRVGEGSRREDGGLWSGGGQATLRTWVRSEAWSGAPTILNTEERASQGQTRAPLGPHPQG